MNMHVVITGAAGGIGRALSEGFLAAGWLVTGLDRADTALKTARYRHRRVDITDEAALDEAFAEAWERSPVSTVFGNAAVTDLDHLAATDLPYERWQRILRVNVDGAFLTGRLAGRRMAAQGFGNIVFVTSSLAFLDQAKANDAPYCASKAAVEMLMRVLAQELAPRVNVNTLFPSVKVDTGFFAHLSPAERADLAGPDILNDAALALAALPRGVLSGVSVDQERFDRDPAYRAALVTADEEVMA